MSARYTAAEIFRVIKDFELAPEKIAAIENAPLDSPALVVAGAGSGKTELLSVRVLWLVANGFARPENILGLTFTKKAATELSKRIFESLLKLRDSKYWPDDLEQEFIPPSISTYNAFANQIFRDNCLALGYEVESKLLTEASAFQLAREVCVRYGSSVSGSLSELELNLENVVQKVLDLSAALSDNGTTASEVNRVIEQTIASITRLPKKAGQEANERFAYIKELVDGLKPTPLIAELAEEYQKEKRKRSVVDYADQVALAYKAITEIPDAKADIQNRYSQVMLDEYQDTSVLQTKLLSTLFANRAVFAVGDPNQSIYGWRGASASNLNEYARDFGSAKVFSLKVSWRNPVKVLSFANQIASPLLEKASFEKSSGPVITPVQLEPKDDAVAGEVNFEFSQDIHKEFQQVATWLAPAAAAGKKCAVLMRKRASMALLVEKLQEQGLDVEVVGLGGLLELPEIVDLVCALKVIQRADSGTELIRLLTGARWRIGVKDIDRLYVLGRKLSGPRQEGVYSDPLTLVEALDAVLSEKLELLSEFSAESLRRLKDAANLFRNLRSATALPLADYVRLVAEELWLDIELRANPKLRTPLAHLQAFFEIVAGFGLGSASSLLSPFLAWLDYAQKKERFEIPKVTPGAGVVQVLTVHAAKGLEWDYVAIPNLVEDDFPSKPRSTSGWLTGAELPFELRGDSHSLPEIDFTGCQIQADAKRAFDEFKADNREYLLREEVRLIYVAITRSKQALMLSGSYWKPANANPRKPSRFLEQLAIGTFEFPELVEATNPLDALQRVESWPLDPLGEKHSKVIELAAKRVLDAGLKLPELEPGDLASSEIHREIDLLLAEQDDRIRRMREVELPVRIPASKFKEFVKDLPTQAASYQRPLPSKPYRQTQLGTIFHAWVEEFMIADVDNSSSSIAELTEVFKDSRFNGLTTEDVEIEINLTKGQNTFVCKLDAVFFDEATATYEVVDWKTGSAPKDKATEQEMILQLALYRFAYSKLRGIPLEKIGVSFFFVKDNLELAPQEVPGPEELIELWEELFS